jgi:hypothetical protein
VRCRRLVCPTASYRICHEDIADEWIKVHMIGLRGD